MTPAATSLPLAGLRVLVTRAAGRAEALEQRLRELGAAPLRCPMIAHGPPDDPAALADALSRLSSGAYDWLILTSRTAVEAVAGGRKAVPAACRIAAVGPATAAACRELLGMAPNLVPEQFVAEELAAALGDLGGERVLLPNADIARPALEERLRAAGALVDRVVAYCTLAAPLPHEILAALKAPEPAAILFTSGSTARSFVEQAGLAQARRLIVACIGPSTATVCRELGLEPSIVATIYTEDGLLEALTAFVAAEAS